jgi:ribosomal protein S12 methylthiotransferase
MSALLDQEGLSETEYPEEADVIIINTCCFIESAREEAINTICEIVRLKEETGANLIVTGCLPQLYKDEIADEIPEVDSWMGLEDLMSIKDLVRETIAGKKLRKIYNSPPGAFQELPRKYSKSTPYSYLKIAEGCVHKCHFCVIPNIRGKYRSLPMETVEKKAREMVEAGKGEIILIAQDTTTYGVDIYGRPLLAELLKKITAIDNLRWLRLMYAHPATLTDEILEVIASEEKICKYIDIPLQHSHPDVLQKMGRPYDEKYTKGVVKRIRKIMPESVIRTSFIVGHPGETEKRFQHLVDFIKEMEFYHLGVFTYSSEEGTPSGEYKSRPSKAEAERRREYLMEVQSEIAFKLRNKMAGKVLPSVCEFVMEQESSMIIHMEGGDIKASSHVPSGTKAICRTAYDAPDIDSLLYITGEPPEKNSFFRAKILSGSEYDLVGTMVSGN